MLMKINIKQKFGDLAKCDTLYRKNFLCLTTQLLLLGEEGDKKFMF